METKQKESTEAEIEKRFKKRLWWTIVIGLVVISLLWFWNYKSGFDGTFGDKFGVVNSLFSGLAFAGIIITIYMQKHELELQRRELKATRRVFRKQSKIMTDQQNDSTFFNLLANHRQMVESLKRGQLRPIGRSMAKAVGTTVETVSGYEVVAETLKVWLDHFKRYSAAFRNSMILDLGEYSDDPIEIMSANNDIRDLYDEICNIQDFIFSRFKNEQQIDFYRRTLWSNLSHEEKLIFEIIRYNFDDQRQPIMPSYDSYRQLDCIDFNNEKLPVVYVETPRGYSENSWVKFGVEASVEQAQFIVYTESKSEYKIVSFVDFKEQISGEKFRIELEDLIVSAQIGIDKFPATDFIPFTKNRFLFVLTLVKNGKRFELLFGMQLREQERAVLVGDPAKYIIYAESVRYFSPDQASQILQALRV